MNPAFSALDGGIVAVYLAGMVILGMRSVRRQRQDSQAYFLAGRSLGWGMIGAALFAANISSIHLVGLAAGGYNEGLVWGNFEWMAVFTLILLGLVFAPFYFESRISTLPEFLERRFGPESRTFLAFLAILTALFIHIGMSMYAGAAVFKEFFGTDVVTSIVVISVITAVYTVLGGLKAVVVTETVQTVILLIGAATVTVVAVLALPGAGIRTLAELKAAVGPGRLSMIQSGSSAGLDWYAVLLGYPVLGIWYWCTDQTIVQRALGARTMRDAQRGALFAGALKILPVFLMVFPGVVGSVLFRNVIGADSNRILPVLINRLVPTGLKGLIAAGLLAALMSTIAAALNSSATLVSMDIIKRLRPRMTNAGQVRIGKLSAVAIMILAMAWSTQGGRYSSIFEAINAIASNIAPPVTTVFLWGVFWRRGTRQASFVTLVVGFVLGAAAFLLDLPVFGTTKIITHQWGIPFLMQAWWLFCFCSLVFVVVSLLTPKPDPKSVESLTWESPLAVIGRGRILGISDPRILAGGLFLLMAILYFVMR